MIRDLGFSDCNKTVDKAYQKSYIKYLKYQISKDQRL